MLAAYPRGKKAPVVIVLPSIFHYKKCRIFCCHNILLISQNLMILKNGCCFSSGDRTEFPHSSQKANQGNIEFANVVTGYIYKVLDSNSPKGAHYLRNRSICLPIAAVGQIKSLLWIPSCNGQGRISMLMCNIDVQQWALKVQAVLLLGKSSFGSKQV